MLRHYAQKRGKTKDPNHFKPEDATKGKRRRPRRKGGAGNRGKRPVSPWKRREEIDIDQEKKQSDEIGVFLFEKNKRGTTEKKRRRSKNAMHQKSLRVLGRMETGLVCWKKKSGALKRGKGKKEKSRKGVLGNFTSKIDSLLKSHVARGKQMFRRGRETRDLEIG